MNARLLSRQSCVPCQGDLPPLNPKEAKSFLRFLPEWKLTPEKDAIAAEYKMKDFTAGMRFMNAIAELAEKDSHHPDFHLTEYRKLRIILSTHAIGGLSQNDFILAAKISRLPKQLKS